MAGTDKRKQSLYFPEEMLKEIQDGTYARNWIAEDKNGRPWFNETRNREQQHQIEEVGAKLRALMPFLKPVKRPEPAGVV